MISKRCRKYGNVKQVKQFLHTALESTYDMQYEKLNLIIVAVFHENDLTGAKHISHTHTHRSFGRQVTTKLHCVYTGALFSWNTQLLQACVTFKCSAIVCWEAAVVQVTNVRMTRAKWA